MSLKAFHIVFIIASFALMAGFAVREFRLYAGPGGATSNLAWGIGSAVLAVVLVVYGIYFLKKLKNISFL
jgi:hypothetical protein